MGTAPATVPRTELEARARRYDRLVTVRADGYLVRASTGAAIQRAGPGIAVDPAGAARVGPYELGRLYYSDGGVMYETDAQLGRTGPPIGELGLEHDLPNRVLDGVQDAVVAAATGLARLMTHPIQTIEGLIALPGAVAQLIANSPEYWERFRVRPVGDQVQAVSELVTTLALTYGSAASTTTRLTAAAADVSEITVNVLRLQAGGTLTVATVSVPVGTVATTVAGAPGAIYVLAMASQAGGGGSGSSGGSSGGPPPQPQGPYAQLRDGTQIRPGREFTQAQKQRILEANRQRNGGVLKSDDPMDPFPDLSEPVRSVSPGMGGSPQARAMAAVDHIKPRSMGGDNGYGNARVISQHWNNILRNRGAPP